ncbi:hypothetical protein Busp01_57400 [Trinickia caryophylli]|nr:hypothetical protein Busp01_57400 [Trinickia caryophylli]
MQLVTSMRSEDPLRQKNFGAFVQSLKKYSETAVARGVDAYFYYTPGTPQSVISAAAKVLDSNFVNLFRKGEIWRHLCIRFGQMSLQQESWRS